MTTVLQRVANTLTCKRYVIGHMREDPSGGAVSFLDPHTLKDNYSGPFVFGIVRFTLEEIRDFTSTQILHRVRDAENKLLEDLGKSEGKAFGTFGVSVFLSMTVLWSVSGFIS
jgi:hypothetical protein